MEKEERMEGWINGWKDKGKLEIKELNWAFPAM
jgi:hypothetical protein